MPKHFNMPTRRKRLRAWSEKALWVSAQTLLQLTAAVIVIAIFVLEDSAFHVASRSRQMQESRPYEELGMERNENNDFSLFENGTSVLQRLQNLVNPDDRVQVYGASVGGRNISESDRNVSQIVNDKAALKQESTMNLTEFHRLAEEKAIEDALRKRLAIESGKRKRSSPNKDKKGDKEAAGRLATTQADKIAANEVAGVSNFSQLMTTYYQGVQPSEENKHLFKSENITYLSFMLYRLIKTHEIRTMIDIPCTKTIFWMPEVLQRLEFEIPRFHYRCIVPDDEHLIEGILRFKHLTSAVVVKDPTVWTSVLPKVDLMLAWYAIGYLRPSRSWQLVQTIRQSHSKYAIFPSHPLVKNNANSETRHGRVNIRKSPYLFDQPMRVVKNMSTQSSIPKDMLLYQVKAIRQGVI